MVACSSAITFCSAERRSPSVPSVEARDGDDEVDVIAMVDDPPLVTYDPADADAEKLSTEADVAYSDLLRPLHRGFNGEPAAVSHAVGKMFDLESAIIDLLHVHLTAWPFAGQFAGPRFRFVS